MSSLMDTLNQDGRFNTFVSAMQASNLMDTLNGPGPFTVFAPTEDAFAGLPEGMVDRIMLDIPSLTQVVSYHIVPGALAEQEIEAHESLTAVEGSAIRVRRIERDTFINDAEIVDAGIRADNGVIHAIDAVLLPPGQ